MYRKEVTRLIIECWGKGLSAEETRKFIDKKEGILIGLNTVYRHRHSITGQKIIDELFRQQRRDIALEQDSDKRMKYRNELLKILVPQRIESISFERRENINRVEDVSELLEKYEQSINRAVKGNLPKNHTAEQVDTAQAHTETS